MTVQTRAFFTAECKGKEGFTFDWETSVGKTSFMAAPPFPCGDLPAGLRRPPNKKTLRAFTWHEGLHPASINPCGLSSSLFPRREKHTIFTRQVFWFPDLSSRYAFPFRRNSGLCSVRPRLQRRVRHGFAPSSLLRRPAPLA